MRGSPSPAGRGARRAQPADNASTASFATSSIKPQQRSHRMSHTLDLDPCLARYTIITVLFFLTASNPEHAANKTTPFVALHFTLTCMTPFPGDLTTVTCTFRDHSFKSILLSHS